MKNGPFTKKQIAESLAGIVEIKDREISYWTDLGIVTPGVHNPKGRGYTRLYNFYNVVDFAIAKRMVDAGMSLRAVKIAIEKLREGNRIRHLPRIMGRKIVVVENPNSEAATVSVKTPERNVLALDVTKAGSFFVLDVTETSEAARGGRRK